MNERAALEIEARSLEPGETVYMRCPFCGGGPNERRNSLGLTHREDGALLFHCFRAGCGAAGLLGGPSAFVRTRPQPKPRNTVDPVEDRLEMCKGNMGCWNMTPTDLYEVGIRFDPETQRLALPVYSPSGVLRGRVMRTMPGDTRQPKTLLWMYEDTTPLAWNRGSSHSDQVVVVEDIVSAMRLQLHGQRAVALMGTHLTEAAKEELDNEATDVVWALDWDASNKASRWCMETRMYFHHSAVLLIDKDFKDMTDEEVVKWLSEVSWLR